MTAKLATTATTAGTTPGRPRIVRTGAGATAASAAVPYRVEMSFGSGRTRSEIAKPASMKGIPSSHGPTSPSALIARWEKSGPKTTGPQTAPDTAPKSTNDMPRARRSGGNISAAAARENWTTPPEPPINASPSATIAPDVAAQPAATTPQPTAPPANAVRI